MASTVVARAFVPLVAAILTVTSVYAQSAKPSELKIGITTFLSGPASVFGGRTV